MDDTVRAETIRTTLADLGYKVHLVSEADAFADRFAQLPYQIVVLGETFACASLETNITLQNLQRLPMSRRRHAVVILIGDSFQSLNPMQAFQHSVHAVVHPRELPAFGQITLKVVADTNLFLHPFRETQQRLAQG